VHHLLVASFRFFELWVVRRVGEHPPGPRFNVDIEEVVLTHLDAGGKSWLSPVIRIVASRQEAGPKRLATAHGVERHNVQMVQTTLFSPTAGPYP
jgi:hypothetical protein